MKYKKDVISLLEKYGFEYKKNASDTDFLAFTYRTGFFHNAELISISDYTPEEVDSKMDNVVKDLERLGFSTKKSFYKSLEELENALFEGFFNIKEWRKKVRLEYIDYCNRVLEALPSDDLKYDYINVPFLKNNKRCETNLVDDILCSMDIKGPLLTIIEAPAGFGKTCTSYELINSLATEDKGYPIPFFTEFSRDRQARIFNHIFVKEVDRSFSSVNSNVVIEEVKNGRIIIILDGFDEILHDSSPFDDEERGFEEAEPMLETIGELLTRDAKIVLTSRRSAIFDGKVFNEWVYQYHDRFKVNRYRLEKPETKDWLSSKRLEDLSSSQIDVSRLANPVLLSYLRFVDDKKFEELCKNTELIVEQYFSSMLEREMDRQDLRMNPAEQKELLKIIAGHMCDHNYTAESKEKIVSVIKELAGELINKARKTYSAKDRPTVDKLATTLANHAFFDRSRIDDNYIEFVNEFVFGNYISENILSGSGEWIADDERFVEPAVLSYAPRSKLERRQLWNGLKYMKEFLDESSKMKFESILSGLIENGYDNQSISSISLKNIIFFGNGKIKNSVFHDCVFSDSDFYFSNFSDVTFINCSFWSCTHSNELGDVSFYNCKSDNNFIDTATEDTSEEEDIGHSHLSSVELYILSSMWPVGSLSIERLHHYIGVILKTDRFTKKEILKGIKLLKRKQLLVEANNVNFVELNKDKISDVKMLLGRI